MKVTYAEGVDRKRSWDALQLNQAAIQQGMAYHRKPIAYPREYDERLRRRKKTREQRRARALHRRRR